MKIILASPQRCLVYNVQVNDGYRKANSVALDHVGYMWPPGESDVIHVITHNITQCICKRQFGCADCTTTLIIAIYFSSMVSS